MKILLVALIVEYIVMAPCFFTRWLEFFMQDTSMSSADRRLSIIILIVGTICWPIVVPIAYLELLKKKMICRDG